MGSFHNELKILTMIQKGIWTLNLVLLGWMIFGGFLDGLVNASEFFDFKIATIFTTVTIILFLIATILLRGRKVTWRAKGGQVVTIKRLQGKIVLPVFGMLLLVWSAAVKGYYRDQAIAPKPVFVSTDTSFKVLILPFHSECEYQGLKYDIGLVVRKRLEQLSRSDTLNLKPIYLTDAIDFSNFSSERAYSLMKFNKADKIIYGFYSLKTCENDGINRICFNYLTDTTNWKIGEIGRNTSDTMTEWSGLESIRNGTGQENIDHIVYYIAGLSAFKHQDYRKSVRLLKKIPNYQNHNRLTTLIGFNYQMLNQFAEAIKYYEQSLKMHPNDDLVLIQSSFAYNNLKKYEAAIENMTAALKINPHYQKGWTFLAEQYLNAEQFDKSIEISQKALAMDNSDARALINLGRAHIALKDIRGIDFLQKGLKIDSTNIPGLGSLAKVYSDMGQFPSAISILQKCNLLLPNNVQLINELARCYQQTGNADSAIMYLRHSLAIDSMNLQGLNLIGIHYMHLGYWDSAKIFLTRALKFNPNDKGTIGNLGVLAMNRSDFPAAIKIFGEILFISPKDTIANYNLAVIYGHQKNKKMAVTYLQKTIALDRSYRYKGAKDPYLKWLFEEGHIK
jgi:tetratricopeptide (TPR) repeat protein